MSGTVLEKTDVESDSRRKFEIYLKPDKASLEKIDYAKALLREYHLITDGSLLEPHLTVYGFYSDYKILGLGSEKELDDILMQRVCTLSKDTFEKLSSNIIKTDFYKDKLVLLFNPYPFLILHYAAVTLFNNKTVLKGNITPSTDFSYFRKRYPYIQESYSPHLALGKVVKSDFVDLLLEEMLSQELSFSELVLSKKCDDRYISLISNPLLIKSIKS